MGITGKWWCDNDSSRSAGSRILYTIWGKIFEDNQYKSIYDPLFNGVIMSYVMLNDALVGDDFRGIILAFGWLDENH